MADFIVIYPSVSLITQKINGSVSSFVMYNGVDKQSITILDKTGDRASFKICFSDLAVVTKDKDVFKGRLVDRNDKIVTLRVADKLLCIRNYDSISYDDTTRVCLDQSLSNPSVTYMLNTLTWYMTYTAYIQDGKITLMPVAIITNEANDSIKGNVLLSTAQILNEQHRGLALTRSAPTETVGDYILDMGASVIPQHESYWPQSSIVMNVFEYILLDITMSQENVHASYGYKYRTDETALAPGRVTYISDNQLIGTEFLSMTGPQNTVSVLLKKMYDVFADVTHQISSTKDIDTTTIKVMLYNSGDINRVVTLRFSTPSNKYTVTKEDVPHTITPNAIEWNVDIGGEVPRSCTFVLTSRRDTQ